MRVRSVRSTLTLRAARLYFDIERDSVPSQLHLFENSSLRDDREKSNTSCMCASETTRETLGKRDETSRATTMFLIHHERPFVTVWQMYV